MSLFLVAALVVAFLLFVVILRSMMVYIPNNRVGILEKLISAKGSVSSGLISLEKEAGFQPELLRGGWHFLKPAFRAARRGIRGTGRRRRAGRAGIEALMPGGGGRGLTYNPAP